MDPSSVLVLPSSALVASLEKTGAERGWIVYQGFDEPQVLASRGRLPTSDWPKTAAVPLWEGTVEVYLDTGSELEAFRLCAEAVARLADAAAEAHRDVLARAGKTLHGGVCQALTAARLELELQAQDLGVGEAMSPVIESLDQAVAGARRLLEELRPPLDP